MVWLMPIAWLAPPSTVNVYPLGSGVPPEVLVDTVRLPVGGGGVGQLTEKDALPVPPAGTVTVRDVPPLTVQLLAMPAKATVWLPVAIGRAACRGRVPISGVAPSLK